MRDSRRKSALDVHLDQDTRVYTAEIFQRVEKSAARVRREKRIAWNWIVQCWLGNGTSEERRDIGHAERSCGVKIKINPSRRDATDRRRRSGEHGRSPAPFLRAADVSANYLYAVVRHDLLDALHTLKKK